MADSLGTRSGEWPGDGEDIPSSDGPLRGVRVLDITSGMAGAVATMLLHDCGAEVTLVEPESGHALRREAGFRVWSRGKARVSADIRTTPGQQRVRALAAHADVVIDDLAPGELKRLGLAPDALREANPGLVHASITACGTRGPWRDLPADEALVTALSGIMRRQPGFREGPSYFVLPLCSYGAALLALHGIGAALFSRERDGGGSRVETSLLAGALAMNGGIFATTERPQPPVVFTRVPLGAMPLYRLYQTQDGRWLHIGGLTARFWPRVALAVDRPDLISDPRFQSAPRMASNEDRDALIRILSSELDRRPFHEWDTILEEHDIPYAPSLTVDEYLNDPQVRQQNLVVTVDDPEVGKMDRLGKVLTFGGTRSAPPEPKPSPPRRPTPNPRPPLTRVRVIDVSGYIAGAYGGAFLADLGADVIKVEGPEGDGLRTPGAGFLNWNRGKRGVCLDLRTEAGRETYLHLVRDADVVLENMRPGVADRLGVGYTACKAVKPDIVYCYVSAHGSSGPYRNKPGFDPLAQARSGIERAQGGLENPPVFLVPPVTDNTAGMLNALGIVLALYHRERTGEGQFVETSLLAAAALLQSESLTAYEGRPPRPVNDRLQVGPHALRRLYQCHDGWLMLACTEARHWETLCMAVRLTKLQKDERFATAEARAAHQGDLSAILAARFSRRRVESTVDLLRRWHIPVAPATGACENVDDPAIAENGYVATFPHRELISVRQAAGLTQVNGLPAASTRAAPLLGEHTRAVLEEACIPPPQLDALFASGAAIESPRPVAV
jgi:crotonobetainyl-CoA:carnitine CoA-transferase CaiB-like acyl-CoA transferase